MLILKIEKDIPDKEEAASYLEVVAKEIREGSAQGDGFDLAEKEEKSDEGEE